MTFEEAKTYVQTNPGKTVYPPWFGKGWSMGWEPGIGKLVDINPHTGSLLVHRDDPRDDCEWLPGFSPKDPR